MFFGRNEMRNEMGATGVALVTEKRIATTDHGETVLLCPRFGANLFIIGL
jgi:hypothetical protein